MQEDLAGKMKNDREKQSAEENRPIDAAAAQPGDRVYVASLDREGVIDSISNDRSSAVVIFGGSIRSRFQTADLFDSSAHRKTPATKGKGNPPRKPSIKNQGVEIPGTVQTSYNTIDLRGQRVEEALKNLDSGLDRMDRNSIDVVILIHGHGTGALKQAVRDHLRMSIYVADYRKGEQGEGGDGVTVVRMR